MRHDPDEGDEVDEERKRLTATRNRMADLLADIDTAQGKADAAHQEAEEALRRFEEGQPPPS